jgi:hypothetical protein
MFVQVARIGFALTAMVLIGCQPTTTNAPKVSRNAGPGETLVTTERAVSLFIDVCGGSLPNFKTAHSRMSKHGATAQEPSGVVFSPSENFSFKVFEEQNTGLTCSIVFASRDTTKAFVSKSNQLGSFTRNFGVAKATAYKNGSLILRMPARPADRKTYYNLRMISKVQ